MKRNINCNGRLLDLTDPIVMGILNITPDSFYDGGQISGVNDAVKKVASMLEEGAAVIDIGGASSRPGADIVPEKMEIERVVPVIEAVMRHFPNTIISIDTWRASVAYAAAQSGAAIINDISAGNLDNKMFETVGRLKKPIILMHMQGTPNTMQHKPQYNNVVQEVLDFLIGKVVEIRTYGISDIIVDPGFGFGKSIDHNYTLLDRLEMMTTVLKLPVLVGLSRKSMIYKLLGVAAEDALTGTAALNMVALQKGAKILRVHDVKNAFEVVTLWKKLRTVGEFTRSSELNVN